MHINFGFDTSCIVIVNAFVGKTVGKSKGKSNNQIFVFIYLQWFEIAGIKYHKLKRAWKAISSVFKM